jgi:hypothetical protein
MPQAAAAAAAAARKVNAEMKKTRHSKKIRELRW